MWSPPTDTGCTPYVLPRQHPDSPVIAVVAVGVAAAVGAAAVAAPCGCCYNCGCRCWCSIAAGPLQVSQCRRVLASPACLAPRVRACTCMSPLSVLHCGSATYRGGVPGPGARQPPPKVVHRCS
eukprot:gene7563-biopygen3062